MSCHEISFEELARAKFTAWIEKLTVRAKLEYIRRNKHYLNTVSIDDLSKEVFSVCDTPIKHNKNEFDFNDKKLENAYHNLSKLRKRILFMLFVEDMTPEEIAKELNCKIDAVYNNRSRALKQLREALQKEEVYDE